jgi:hypothetical protein
VDLESTFGCAFFVPGHPVRNWAWGASATSCRRFLHLRGMLRATENAGNAEAMRAKLAHVKEAQKTLDVLEWWSGLIAQGCDVTFEPPLPHKHGQADLHVTTPQECYVELTELEISQPRASMHATHQLLTHLLHADAPSLCHAGRFIRALPAEDWTDFINEILWLRKNAERSGLAILELQDGFLLGLAAADHQEALIHWATEHGLEVGHLLSPPLPALEQWRVRRKIKEKAMSQLPLASPGILVLYSHEIYLQDAVILDTLRFLREELVQWPQVSALVLTSLYLYLNEKELTATHEGHRIITRDNGSHRQCTLIVYNPTTSSPLKEPLRSCVEHMLTTAHDFSRPSLF